MNNFSVSKFLIVILLIANTLLFTYQLKILFILEDTESKISVEKKKYICNEINRRDEGDWESSVGN